MSSRHPVLNLPSIMAGAHEVDEEKGDYDELYEQFEEELDEDQEDLGEEPNQLLLAAQTTPHHLNLPERISAPPPPQSIDQRFQPSECATIFLQQPSLEPALCQPRSQHPSDLSNPVLLPEYHQNKKEEEAEDEDNSPTTKLSQNGIDEQQEPEPILFSKKRKDPPTDSPRQIYPVKGILKNPGTPKVKANAVRFNFDTAPFVFHRDETIHMMKKQRLLASSFQWIAIPTGIQTPPIDLDSQLMEHEVPSTPPPQLASQKFSKPTVLAATQTPATPSSPSDVSSEPDFTSRNGLAAWTKSMRETARANQALKAELESQMQYLASLIPKFEKLPTTTPGYQVEALVTSNFERVNNQLDERLRELEGAIETAVDNAPMFGRQAPAVADSVEGTDTAALQCTIDQLQNDLKSSSAVIQFLSAKMTELEKVVFKK